ncbi:MAG: hypothetical protein ACREJ2_13460 [Planctomycetota bacterium]
MNRTAGWTLFAVFGTVYSLAMWAARLILLSPDWLAVLRAFQQHGFAVPAPLHFVGMTFTFWMTFATLWIAPLFVWGMVLKFWNSERARLIASCVIPGWLLLQTGLVLMSMILPLAHFIAETAAKGH